MPSPELAAIEDDARPIVVVGAHGQSLFMHVCGHPARGRDRRRLRIRGDRSTAARRPTRPWRRPAWEPRFASSRSWATTSAVAGSSATSTGRAIDRRWVARRRGRHRRRVRHAVAARIPAIASCQDLSRAARRRDSSRTRRGRSAARRSSSASSRRRPRARGRRSSSPAAAGAHDALQPRADGPVARRAARTGRRPRPEPARGRRASSGAMDRRPSWPIGWPTCAPWAHVIVTAGEDGAYLSPGGRAEPPHRGATGPSRSTPPGPATRSSARSPRACGTDESVEEAAAFAVSAAALSVTRPGTLEAFVTRDAGRRPRVPCPRPEPTHQG